MDEETPARRTPREVLTRRDVLAGAAAALAGSQALGLPATAPARPARPRAPADPPGPWRHAKGNPRGSDIAVAVGRDKEGRYGVMFKKLEAFEPSDDLLRELAAAMVDPAGPDAPHAELDNPDVPAGYTFLGQFIDHDMTFDRTPLTEQKADPKALRNFDTPHFDLNSVYGSGRDRDPQLYDGDRMRLGEAGGLPDLPRESSGRALVGDPRNDENLILTQLHLLFLQLHNRLVDEGRSFAEAQRLTRWHFQWIVVHDFLPRVAGQAAVDRFLARGGGNSGLRVKREHYKPKNPNRPMMPLEYSVAAYRFGHSMVRGGYKMGATAAPVFASPPSDSDLHGGRPIPAGLRLAWPDFFEVPGGGTPANRARLIDRRLAHALFHLPVPQVVPPTPPVVVNLAERNLLRGKRLGLPSGQAVARAMGETPITNEELGLDARWGGEAPLWYYLLAEAELRQGGRRLGPVGGRIVAEVILGILDADRGSYLHARDWTPSLGATPGRFAMGDVVRFAQGG